MPEDEGTADVKRAVAELTAAVREGTSPERIAGICQEVLAKQGLAARQRRSYSPEDYHERPRAKRHSAELVRLGKLEGRDRLKAIHAGDPRTVAEAFNLDLATVRELQERSDELLILSSYAQSQGGPGDLASIARDSDYYTQSYLPAFRAAMDTATTAEGLEFVPVALSGSLIERVALALMVADLFPTFEQPTNPYDVPGFPIVRQRGGKHDEQTADTGQTKIKKITAGTRKVTLTAKKFAIECILSAELDEDSLIPVLPFLQEELQDYIAADIEDTVINGDDSGTHQDYDTTAADDPRKNWKGLRKVAIAGAKTDAAGAVLTSAMLRKNRSLMGKYGARADQLAHVIPISSYVTLLSETNVQTLEKYGPQATILTGELGRIDGVPIIVSEYVRTDLNAAGVNDQTAANNTKTIAVTVNRRGFFSGIRRSPSIQILRELYAESDQLGLIASVRRSFAARFPTATEKVVALHYNVLP